MLTEISLKTLKSKLNCPFNINILMTLYRKKLHCRNKNVEILLTLTFLYSSYLYSYAFILNLYQVIE